MDTTLGIDLGTQHLKVVIYDGNRGEVVASAASALEIHQRADGTAEQRVQWWLDALIDAMSQLGKEFKDRVSAIGVSGQQHGFVPICSDGAVLVPVKLWCDTSTQDQCDAIMAAAGGEQQCIQSAGNPILAGYTASKVVWLKEHHKPLYDQMDCILLPHDYLNFYLTGERCMEPGDASGTGFLDIATRGWSSEILDAMDSERDLRDVLPTLRLENEFIGKLRSEVADQLRLPHGIGVSVGGGDNMMSAIGTGNVTEGHVTISLGTSGTAYAYSETPVIDERGEIAAFCSSSGGWLPLLCTMNCTAGTELMRSLFGADIEGFEALIAQARPGSDGVLTLPFFNGERTPNLPQGKGCIFGLDTRNTDSENILRSAMEGATFALLYGVDRLIELGVDCEEIVLTGGGANSPTWRQTVADVCNKPVTFLEKTEGAALGAALQAFSCLTAQNLVDCAEDFLSVASKLQIEPNNDVVGLYADIYTSYREAVENVSQMYR